MRSEDVGLALSDDIAAAGRGDRAAMRRVFVTSGGRLLALILRVTNDRGAAEDVLQETFIKVWNRAPSYDPARSAAMVWLAAIARNSAIDWYRAHRRHAHHDDDSTLAFIGDEAEAADVRMIREQEERRAVISLGTLSPEQEGELRGAFFQGLTYSQLAERKGVPLGTMKSRIRRSLLVLRGRLDRD